MIIPQSLALSTLVLAGMAWATSVSAQEVDREQWEGSVWQVSLSLNAPNLVPPAVQWSIRDKDPVPGFKARVKTMRSYYRKRLEHLQDELKKERERSAQMRIHWDRGFKEVTGDEVYLLTWAPGVSHSLSAMSPDGKKWIVTKIVPLRGKYVCWSLPIEVKAEETIEVTLTEDNLFDLESAFDDAMRGPGQGKQKASKRCGRPTPDVSEKQEPCPTNFPTPPAGK